MGKRSLTTKESKDITTPTDCRRKEKKETLGGILYRVKIQERRGSPLAQRGKGRGKGTSKRIWTDARKAGFLRRGKLPFRGKETSGKATAKGWVAPVRRG